MRALRSSLLISASALALSPSTADVPIRGFFPQSVRAERDLEARFKSMPDPARMRAAMQRLTARPHHVGSPYDKENADWLLAEFKSYGFDANIETFDVLFPTPVERVVELIAPTTYKASLEESALEIDPTSRQRSEQLPPYNAYSIDGDVTGPLVFVNRGVPDDYDELARRGISVKGAIVIAKYGGSWRGIKPKVAAEHGAVGCLIYSDPRDDGYGDGDVFPAGPMRPAQGAQRGSVMDLPVYPGDPLPPGVGATKEAKRLPIAQATTLTKIPVLPISYGDAQPLLAALGGPVVPASWRGGLPITYRLGGDAAKVHLRVRSEWGTRTLYNVIARLPGTTEADQWIIRGNHHDAWVNGAEDPISGLVAELEEARALGALAKQGWRHSCSMDLRTNGATHATARTFASTRSARAPTTRASSITSGLRRSTSDSEERTQAGSITPHTTTSTGTHTSATPRSCTGVRSRRRPGSPCSGWRMRTSCRSGSRTSRRRSVAT